MAQITQQEMLGMARLLSYEEACYEKFSQYAQAAKDSAVRKLCAQLADRSREHYAALLSQIDAGGDTAH